LLLLFLFLFLFSWMVKKPIRFLVLKPETTCLLACLPALPACLPSCVFVCMCVCKFIKSVTGGWGVGGIDRSTALNDEEPIQFSGDDTEPDLNTEDTGESAFDKACRDVLDAVNVLMPMAQAHGEREAQLMQANAMLRNKGQLLDQILDKFTPPHLSYNQRSKQLTEQMEVMISLIKQAAPSSSDDDPLVTKEQFLEGKTKITKLINFARSL
jgi:hypothetical protein